MQVIHAAELDIFSLGYAAYYVLFSINPLETDSERMFFDFLFHFIET